MTTKQNQIVACVDGSVLTDAVCDYASWVSQKTGVPLKLLHSINHHQESSVISDFSGKIGLGSKEELLDEFTDFEQQRSKFKMQEGKLILQAATERIESQGINSSSIQRHGDLIDAVTDMEESISMLVLGLRGRVHANQKSQIGSKLEAVIRAIHHPVLIVNDNFKQPEHIMLAYDGSVSSDKALKLVATNPLFKGAVCHLVYVSKGKSNSAKLLNYATPILRDAENHLEVIAVNLKGNPAKEMCNYEEEKSIDLTVMGGFSHHRLHDMILGSVTHKMLLHTKKPLLLLR